MRGQRIAGIGVTTVAAFGAWMTHAEPQLKPGAGTFGLPGLIDMPTAESNPEGLITASVFRFPGALRITATFQVTDRLTGAFRYSRVPGVFTGGTALYDRSFDVQYRVLDEKGWRPAVAIGLRDFIGTGVYSGEYIVASKTITPRLRATAGLGWGRLGSHGDIGSPFGTRPALNIGEGGKANTDQFFRGPVAPFVGLAWQATDRLALKAEYSSDAYPRETAAGTFSRDSSVNLGFEYRFNKWASVTGYYLYGTELGLQFNLVVDPRQAPAPSGLETAPLPVRPRPSPAADPEAWATDWTSDPEVQPGGHFFAATHTMSRYRSAFYEPLVADWQNFGNWTQSGARTATERATDIWKKRLAEFEPPASAAAVADGLDAFIARRTAEGGAAPVS